jgi:MORN repeat
MGISTREISETVSDTEWASASTWTDLSTQASTLTTNLTVKVISNHQLTQPFNETGLYIWKDGERYEGEWQEGKFHGKGTKTLPDGTIFDGDWEEGRPVG